MTAERAEEFVDGEFNLSMGDDTALVRVELVTADPANGLAGSANVVSALDQVADQGHMPLTPEELDGLGPADADLVQTAESDDSSFVIDDCFDGSPAEQANAPEATDDSVKAYLREIGRVPLLNAEQEVELSKHIEAGLYAEHLLGDIGDVISHKYREDFEWAADGIAAKKHLIEANLRLVVSAAKHKTGKGVALLDLIQDGNVGLLHAVEKFDYTKGYKFSTYAMWWIRQAIQKAFPDQAHMLCPPVHVQGWLNKIARTNYDYQRRLGRDATVDELATELDRTPEQITDYQRGGKDPVSIHATIGEDGESELGDLIEDVEAVVAAKKVEFTDLQQQLRNVLDTLSEREAGVLDMRFGLTDGKPKTLDEIGKAYGCTRERIRQLEKIGLSKLRHPSRAQILTEYR